MRITCNYCESTFELSDNTKCPNCGAPIADELKQENKRQNDIEKKKLELEEKRIEIEKEKVKAQQDQAMYSFIGSLLHHINVFPRVSYSIKRGARKIWRIIIIILVLIALYFIFTNIVPMFLNQ